MKCKAVNVSYAEFQQCLWKGLWDTWKCSFMAERKAVLINVAENRNSPMEFGKNLPYRISETDPP
jgi:hypothetical protein